MISKLHWWIYIVCFVVSFTYGHTHRDLGLPGEQGGLAGRTVADKASSPGNAAWDDPAGLAAGGADANLEKVKNLVVPVLYYHAVNDRIYGIRELIVSPAEFAQQMEYLKEHNYRVITFDQLAEAYRYHQPVLITFDDGYEDNYTNAYPILKKYNFPATIFVCAGFIGRPNFLKPDEIRSMKGLISIGSHTMTHPFLSRIAASSLEYELSESQKELSAITGAEVNVFAYPTGDYNDRVLQVTKRYYRYGVVMGGGIYQIGDDPYLITRVYVPRGISIDVFAARLREQH